MTGFVRFITKEKAISEAEVQRRGHKEKVDNQDILAKKLAYPGRGIDE